LEGNREHAYSAGGLCAVGQASLLGLYDSQRIAGAHIEGRPATWDEVDRAMGARVGEVLAAGGRVRLLSDTVTSPTEKRLIDRFLGQFTDARHVVYDPLSSSAILDAHLTTHGQRLLPRYDFEQADVIVSFGADFLGTWISPVEFTAAYHRGRRLDGDSPHLSHHTQLEGRMSLTGSNADLRVRLDPADAGLVLSHLVQKVAEIVDGESPAFGSLPTAPLEETILDDLAARLSQARGRALIVSGSQSQGEQVLVNYLNEMLGAYGATLDVERPSWQLQGDDRALARLVAEIREGSVDLLLIRGVNPAYDLPGAGLAQAIEDLPFVVSLAGAPDETSAVSKVICPEPHFLEAWRDAEAVAGVVAVTQPAIEPLNDTRTLAESLSLWLGEPRQALELIQETWREEIFPRASAISFQRFWDQTVHDGSANVSADPVEVSVFDATAVQPLTGNAKEGQFTLEIYPKVALRDGRHAHNPWLQELPDPITKVVWDNYACLSPNAAQGLGVGENDVVRLEIQGEPAVELPVYVQPGQHDQVVSVALGYGRAGTDRFAGVAPKWLQGKPTIESGATIGKNVAPLTTLGNQGRRFVRPGLLVTPTGATQNLASTQTYNYLSVPAALAPTTGEDRPIIQETVLPDYVEDRSAGEPHQHHFDSDLWGQHEFETHHWAMAVDLSACTGCSACVISCQAENNVPVVGRDEVERRREMQWIRIDRYYRGEGDDPDTVHQPMMCHHCDNAPCETVCPVVATLHSSEGLNMQAYNRCVGTRYCANNCPYKVRRFNWFDYAHEDKLQNLLLNPDVTVRERGVMEKCSFCVQRIQASKFEAQSEGREMVDGDIQTACQQSCPAQAIVFGDLNDPESRISKLRQDPRHYVVFEELNVQPSVGYMRLVRNRPASSGEHGVEKTEDTHHG
jgi:molybdopterin-containing oxidoreductase family iron-sulfur binding subunit